MNCLAITKLLFVPIVLDNSILLFYILLYTFVKKNGLAKMAELHKKHFHGVIMHLTVMSCNLFLLQLITSQRKKITNYHHATFDFGLSYEILNDNNNITNADSIFMME